MLKTNKTMTLVELKEGMQKWKKDFKVWMKHAKRLDEAYSDLEDMFVKLENETYKIANNLGIKEDEVIKPIEANATEDLFSE